jgi:hypothetical protein
VTALQRRCVSPSATGPDGDTVIAALLARGIAIEFEVGVGEEHGLAPITALRDMTRKAGNDEIGDAVRDTDPVQKRSNDSWIKWGFSKVAP